MPSLRPSAPQEGAYRRIKSMQIYKLFATLATHTSISISYQLKEANRRDKFAPSKPLLLLRLPHPTIKTQSLLRCMPQQDTHLTRKRGKGAITRLSLRNRTRQTYRPRSPRKPKAKPGYSSLNECYKQPQSTISPPQKQDTAQSPTSPQDRNRGRDSAGETSGTEEKEKALPYV